MHQLERRRGAIAICALIAVAGCTTTDDPSRGGFVSGVTNLANGGYDRRLQAQETELAVLQNVHAQLDARHAEIEAQRRDVRAERDALSAQLAGLDQANAMARQKLDDALRNKRAAAAQLTLLIDEQKAIEAELVPLVRRSQTRSAIVSAAQTNGAEAPETPSIEDAIALDLDRKKAAELAERQRKVDRIMDEVLAPGAKRTP